MKKIVIADYESALEEDYSITIESIEEALGEPVDTVVYAYKDKDDFIKVLQDADGLVTGFIEADEEILAACPGLKCISVSGVGYSNINLESAKQNNVAVCHIQEYCTQEVAEHAIALMCALNRNLKFYDRQINDKREWKYYSIDGNPNLCSQTLAIFGFGKIGRCVATIAIALGMKVLAVDPYAASEYDVAGVEFVNKEEAFSRADIITNHMNLTEENRHFFDEDAFVKMKRRPIFINVGRGGSVDEQALVNALNRGLIRGAGIDVLEEENPDLNICSLLRRKNVIITPHSAFYSQESIEKLQRISGANLGYFLAGKNEEITELVR